MKKFLSVGVGLITLFFGSDPVSLKLVYALMVFMCFDIFTGLIACCITKQKFDYRVFGIGLLKKIVVLMAVSFGHYLDYFNIFNASISFQSSFAGAFCMVEILSNIQNISKTGIKLPVVDEYINLK